MFDASAKIPSGILSGNVNQYGDFDECLSLDGAQYCLAEIDPRPSWKEPFLKFKSLVHSHFNIKEEFSDVSFEYSKQCPVNYFMSRSEINIYF